MTYRKCTGSDAPKPEPCPDFKAKPIDLTQFEGHTPGEWVVVDVSGVPLGVGVTKGIANIMVCNTLFEGDRDKDLPRRGADATLIAAAPEMKDEIIALRGEVHQLTKALDEPKAHLWAELKNERNRRDALTATNNSLVDTCNELRAELSKTKDTAVDTIRELRAEVKRLRDLRVTEYCDLVTAHNTLKSHAANLAGALLKLLNATDTRTMPIHILSSSQITLDKYYNATGGDNNADSTKD